MHQRDLARGSLGRVCLVTPGYISSTPRVVREADALTAAGFDVRVVFTQGHLEAVREFDDPLVSAKPWHASAVRWSKGKAAERWAFYRSGIRHRVAEGLAACGVSAPGIAERAEGRIYPELARLAAAEAADLFIGHYPTGLAAAAQAAERHRAALGYDVEDLYADTFPESAEWSRVRERILMIERRYLPRCRHVTAVSGPVAEAFAERYATRKPVVVHNCHPFAERQRIDGQVLERRGSGLSLFWFSQTVGLDRGIQDAIRAAGRLGGRAQLHLRGFVADDVRRELEGLAAASGLGSGLYFHPRCAPADLLLRAAEHDVGVALEQGLTGNNRLTVSNKLFTYLTAGLATVATNLPGHRTVFAKSPDIGALLPVGDVETLAAQLEFWSRDALALLDARRAAVRAARELWNAEAEGRRLVRAVEDTLACASKASVAIGE